MMGFSAFMMSTDQVPSTNLDSTSENTPSWMRADGASSLGGGTKEKPSPDAKKRQTVTTFPEKLGAGQRNLAPHGGRLSGARPSICGLESIELPSAASIQIPIATKGSRRSGLTSPGADGSPRAGSKAEAAITLSQENINID
jgi:hypothetical protein